MLTCINNVLNAEALGRVHAMIAECEFVDGKLYASGHNADVKASMQMDQKSPGRKDLNDFLFDCLTRSEKLMQVAMPAGIGVPRVTRYGPGMRYGEHSDGAIMFGGSRQYRADISVTLFLNDPASYDGGELVLANPFGKQKIKLPAGAAAVYPASLLHEVSEVTRGERLVAVLWMQSRVRDPARRELIDQSGRVAAAMNRLDPDSEEARLSEIVHHNLTRMWSEC